MPQPTDTPSAQQPISLLEFNGRIKQLLNAPALQNCWIKAETSDVRVKNHCYLELVQKNADGAIVAKMTAIIWSHTYAKLNDKFRQVTGQNFGTGMNLMLNVSVSYHEQYGMKVAVNDINPEFTLGDMVRQRMEIIKRLTAEHLIDRNKQLSMPAVPQRIAIISSDGAAGYGDFMKQLNANAYGLQFYTCLFHAMMQGSSTAPSIISAINRIESHADLFDCIVIIRGGGSSSDLNSFDSYDAAARIAQCKLPVIVGIGHERDVTVLDYVAHTRVKTPTAAAEFLVQCGTNALARLSELTTVIVTTARNAIAAANEHLSYISGNVPIVAQHLIDKNKMMLRQLTQTIPLCVNSRIAFERNAMQHHTDNVATAAKTAIQNAWTWHNNTADKLELLSPRNILNRGFAVAMHNGKIVSSITQVSPGDTVTVHLRDGRMVSKINTIK